MFEVVTDIDDAVFFSLLIEAPQKLKITSVGDLKESNSNNNHYFYIDFLLLEKSQEIGIGFNVKVNDDGKLYVGEGSKLYPLLSFVSGINEGSIKCNKSDIDEALLGLEFLASARREKVGNKKWYIIVPQETRGE